MSLKRIMLLPGFLLVFAVLISSCFDDSTGTYTYTHKTGIKITSKFNNTETIISANAFIPDAKIDKEIFPAIVFINSWGMDENEYLTFAEKLASKGYIALSYSCRGWGESGGVIKMGGIEDRTDFSAVLDWLEANTPVDIKNLAVSGISLGGGGSLHAVSSDPRVKTVAALSSYIDAGKSMFSDETPRLVWGFMLIASGALKGEMTQELYNVYLDTLTNTNIDWLYSWGAERSPITYINDLNRLNKPIYLSHNFGDHLFRTDVTIDYFNRLTVDHKRLDINQGTHGSGEAPGLFNISNYSYENVQKWFDYWLKGIDTGIIPNKEKSAVITMEVKQTGERVEFNTDDLKKTDSTYSWPANSTAEKKFYIGPRSLLSFGSLGQSPAWQLFQNIVNTIESGLISGATSGIPIISQGLEQFKLPVITNINLMNFTKAAVYKTGSLSDVIKLRGNSEINMNISVSQKKGQVFFYLYDVDIFGNAQYITMGYKTFWNSTPGAVMNVNIKFISAAYDIKKGHSLALVMDTDNPEFGKPTLTPFNVMFHFNKNNPEGAVLKITHKK